VLNAPVKIGDVVVKNVCDTGVDIVATRNVSAS
jgi:CxxC motif-containing protein